MHDFVIRLNLGPVTGYAPIVGSNTHARVLNSESVFLAARERGCGMARRSDRLHCPRYLVLLNTLHPGARTLYHGLCNGSERHNHRVIEAYRQFSEQDVRMRALTPGRGHIMTGAWAIGLALALCPNGVTVYGISSPAAVARARRVRAKLRYHCA